MSEAKVLNIYQRINEVRKLIDYVQKDKDVSMGTGKSYKAVSHDAVTALLRTHMVTFGIIMVPNFLDSELMPPDTAETKQRRYVANYNFQFVNADDPEQSISVIMEAHAMDNADKAPGKALSYAAKYALLKLFNIETGEDEESRHQEEEKPITKEQIEHLLKVGAEVKADMAGFRKRIRVNKIDELPASQYDAALALLEAKRPKAIPECTPADFKKKEASWKAAVEAGEITAEDLITQVGTVKTFTPEQLATINSWEKPNAEA